MDQLITVLGMVVQLVVGYLVKKNSSTTNKIRKFIPIGNLVVAIITQIIASTQAALPPVVAPAVAMAGFFGTFGKGFLDIFVNSLIQTFLVTGVHSTGKNVAQGLK